MVNKNDLNVDVTDNLFHEYEGEFGETILHYYLIMYK